MAEQVWEVNYDIWTEEYAKAKYKVTAKRVSQTNAKQVWQIIEKQD